MNGRNLLIISSLAYTMANPCWAVTAPEPPQSAIQFQGGLIEPSCGHADTGPFIELKNCVTSRADAVDIHIIQRRISISGRGQENVSVKLIQNGGTEPHYVVVDGHGAPVSSGLYLVTLTSP